MHVPDFIRNGAHRLKCSVQAYAELHHAYLSFIEDRAVGDHYNLLNKLGAANVRLHSDPSREEIEKAAKEAVKG
jgi:hypothetical protein